ncbi:hypothetical protein H5410_018483 [Solanum commersonii]|uniref:Uncharacterized protein n=1 Tax=Solanum commersonii TaxID=4109 RepID=A0A9J6A2Y6_SOLCO|nr:hypothetical protein H5410_018483 [Solanum commersonii]
MMSIYLERNCAKDATPDQICGDDYAYQPCIAGRWAVICHRDSLNQIRNAMIILSSYKIKADTASVSDAICTNYSDFTAN